MRAGPSGEPLRCFLGPTALVRFLLLTATRRSEAAEMTRGELAGGDWIVPAVRMKAKVEHVVPLSAKALSIIEALPGLGPSVFTNTGARPANNFAEDQEPRPAQRHY
jgi:integrase